jgi:hypothetical protein
MILVESFHKPYLDVPVGHNPTLASSAWLNLFWF